MYHATLDLGVVKKKKKTDLALLSALQARRVPGPDVAFGLQGVGFGGLLWCLGLRVEGLWVVFEGSGIGVWGLRVGVSGWGVGFGVLRPVLAARPL